MAARELEMDHMHQGTTTLSFMDTMSLAGGARKIC